jgi:hypothetical protein
MKLRHKETSRQAIDTDYESTNTKWVIICDEHDFDGNAKMLERFGRIEVSQRHYHNDGINRSGYTWFKGSRTNHFEPDTKDKVKRRVVEIINEFLINNDIEMKPNYNPVKPN